MWFFENHALNNSEQIIRWAFLFAAPTLFDNFENTDFSSLHLFIGILLLTFFYYCKNYVCYLKSTLEPSSWNSYGRLITFWAHVIFNCNVASQIWTGLVISKIVSGMFQYHNSLQVFWSFAVTLIFGLSVLQSSANDVTNLR